MTNKRTQQVIDFANTIKGLITAHYNITGNSSQKGHVQAGGAPQDIGTSSAAGTDNGYYARADHVHKASYDNLINKPTIPSANTTASNIKMDGTQSAGSATTYAKADHIHPTDTSRAASNHTHNEYASSTHTHSGYITLSDIYQTKIEASNYNVSIDSTDNVITVTLLDFNNQPVTNKSVTLTCDKGYFTKKGSTNISGKTTKSVSVNTDSNGKITATWTASEWGLCTFSANSNKVQINVKGCRTSSNQYINKYEFETYYQIVIVKNTNYSVTPNYQDLGSILSSVEAPEVDIYQRSNGNDNVLIRLGSNGHVLFRTTDSSRVTSNLISQFIYRKKW